MNMLRIEIIEEHKPLKEKSLKSFKFENFSLAAKNQVRKLFPFIHWHRVRGIFVSSGSLRGF